MFIGNLKKVQSVGNVHGNFTPGPYAIRGNEIVSDATGQAVPATPQNLNLFANALTMFESLERIKGCLSQPGGQVDATQIQRAWEIANTTTELVLTVA